jgi:hypothetical protein
MAFEDDLAKELAELIRHHVDTAIKPLQKRLERLELRGELKYCGVWQQQKYQPGCLVTLGGGLWHCEMHTESRPGTDACWRLAVKSGGRSHDAR